MRPCLGLLFLPNVHKVLQIQLEHYIHDGLYGFCDSPICSAATYGANNLRSPQLSHKPAFDITSLELMAMASLFESQCTATILEIRTILLKQNLTIYIL